MHSNPPFLPPNHISFLFNIKLLSRKPSPPKVDKMYTIKDCLPTNFFLLLCIIHFNFFNVKARVTIIFSKDQTSCRMCDACDNPCPPVFFPPPPPPVPDCEPPPSLPPPPPRPVSDCEPPPSPPTSGMFYYSPPPPAVVAYPYYSPPLPASYHGYSTPPPPNPILPYFPYYWYNTPPSISVSKSIQLKNCHPIVVFIVLVLSFVCLC